MEFRPDFQHIVACYMNRERAPAFVRGLNSLGIPATSFEGGMKKLATMSVEQVKLEIPYNSLVTLVWSRSDGREVKIASEDAMRVLINAGIHNRVHGVMDFMCFFYGRRVNLETIFY